MTFTDRPFTAAAVPAVERRCRETLAALLSRLEDVAGDGLAGAALGGALGRGEAPTTVDAEGAFVTPVPFELLVVLDVTPGRAASLAPRLRRELAATARARSADVRLSTAARSALAQLPPTLTNLETAAADRILAGPATLLAPLAPLAAARPAADEALALLVRRGAALLLAERCLSRRTPSRSALLAGQAAVRTADLALGTALLVSAGRFRPTDAGRDTELRLLAAPAGDGPPPSGFHLRMSRTRFRDVIDRHRAAVEAAREVDLPDTLGEARAQAGRATDRFVEVLRLLEEERLSRPLPSWTDYVRALSERNGGSPGPGLFEPSRDEALPSRRSVRAWPVAERLAPALATLLDWDPGDLAIVPLLLDLPEDATKAALGARLVAWAASA